LSGTLAADIAGITLTVVAMSIVVHGLSAQPLMQWYERRSQPVQHSQGSRNGRGMF
jgi:NhaP-type Na+/H+ or K+/H+ antiporter